MKKQKLLACLTALCMTVTAFAPIAQPVQAQTDVETAEASSTLNVIPKPSEYTMNEGTFTLGADAEIAVIAEDNGAAAELTNTGEYIAEVFRASTGYELPVVEKTEPENGDITLRLNPDGGYAEQAYAIDVTTDQVIIEAGAPVGIFYGVQTLRQMLPADIESEELVSGTAWTIPCAQIADEPEYGLRSMMLDVTRHFFTVDQVKRQLDMLSQYKINTLHMHLSDDQGWRLEIKGEMYGESLDKLRTIGAQTSCNTNGIRAGQYTQEEFKEIVAYANERCIQIVPEFDMPSHAWAALVSLSFLNSTEDGRPPANGYDNTRPYEGWDVGFNSLECRNEKTYEFIDEVFRQVSEISPSKYIHIGGDEAHVTSHDDYVYFMNRVTEIAKKYGKTPIGWQNYDTAVENPEGTVTQFWSTGNAKFEEGINYVVSPADHAYMDMKYDSDCPYGLEWATHNPVDDSYNWDPTDYGSKDQIVGVETCLFTETIATDEALDYMIYPRVLGHAEIGWTAKEDRSWDEYKTRLATHDARLELQGIGYKRDAMIWYNPVNFRMPMDEGIGTTIDAASGPYSGTMNGGVSWTEGKYGTALHLDGTSGYIDIGAPDVQDEWTIGMWVNREAAEGNNAALISGTQGELKIEQYKDTKKVGVTKYGEVDAAFDYELPEGEWVHLTFTGNSEGVNLYVNGEYSGHLDVVMNGPASRIGANSASGLADMGYMKGSADDLQIYNSVLSEEEIAEMMEDPYGFGEEAYWTMNEGEGETITDESGQNIGTLTNVGWGEGQEGSALQFSGEGYVDLGYRDAIGDWTIGMWVKAGDTVGTNAVLVSSSVSEIKLDQWNKTGKVGITEAGVADYTFDYSAPKGEWVHLTFVGDSNGTTLYVNGEEQDHLDATIDGPMYRLGASSGSSITGYLNGSLDDVRFYTRALSADEVAEIAQVSTDDETASEAAIAALQTMVDKAVALGSDDAALNEAITNAQAVLAKEAPTATEVVTALLDLSEAMQALNTDESTDALRADVQATIDFINENILNDVEGLRPGKVQALRDAVQAAQDVVNDPDATADELQAANKAMTKAAQELWEIVTKAELEALIEAANGYLDGDYTAESLEALQVAITAAQAVAENDDATTAEVTEAITNLSNTIAGLVEEAGVDKSALAYEIELVNEMLTNIDNYVPSSVEGLADKLASAQQVYDDVNAAQDAVDAATQALREARLNARTKADVSALEELIAYANSLDLSGYSRASVAVLNQAIAQNKLLLSDPEVSQDKVDAAVTEIQNAIDALEPVSETAGSTTADSTNTAAASTMGMMAALMAAAGAAAVMAYRRKRS
ncbi:MAG: family 20 glycosylhydrolase [Merdibacter sp.]